MTELPFKGVCEGVTTRTQHASPDQLHQHLQVCENFIEAVLLFPVSFGVSFCFDFRGEGLNFLEMLMFVGASLEMNIFIDL